MLTQEQKEQFSEILEELGKTLDITETEFNTAVKSYEAVGKQLTKENSELIPYNPEILPQGSFMLGTMVRPINDDDDLDIDLVCQLTRKRSYWTQYNVKQAVGDQLKENETYKKMIKKPEGRRCWTLKYADDSNYHLDILPSIVDSGYKIILEKAFTDTELKDTNELAIRITDKEEDGYLIETDHLEWLKSNPFGYARWFFNQAMLDIRKAMFINESIQPVRGFQKEKLPLQRVVQILKRHRDIMFNGDDDKPISIIITTLASKAYAKETNILVALQNVIQNMPSYIEERYSEEHKKIIKWIPNPVNGEENFADKWPETPQKQKNFYDWMGQVQIDVENILSQRNKGLQYINEAFQNPFGKDTVKKAFNTYGDNLLEKRKSGALKMAAGTGTLGTTGRATVKDHNFHGQE